jgi:ribosomal protein S18 acetylase RimI-like enzyme
MPSLRLIDAATDQPPVHRAPRIRVRPMMSGDLEAAEAIATAGFVGNDFYRTLLGLDARQFRAYWARFLPFVLHHPASRSFVLEIDGEPRGVLASAFSGFASPARGIAFAAGLAPRIHPGAMLRYLGFVRFYEALMQVPPIDRVQEARGLWLAVDRRRGEPPLGALLLRGAVDALRAEGKTFMTGMADGSSTGILAFYRRLGFRLEDPVFFRGCRVVRVVHYPDHSR